MSFKDEGYFDKRPNGLSGKPSAKDNSIDKILGELLDQYEIGNNTVMECKYEAKAQLLAEILKVIGEDEEEVLGEEFEIWGRNQLKAELRTKLEQLFNVKEKK